MIFYLYVIKGSASSTFEINAYSWIEWKGHSLIVISFIPIIPTNKRMNEISLSLVFLSRATRWSYLWWIIWLIGWLIEWILANTEKELAGALMWHCPNCSDSLSQEGFLVNQSSKWYINDDDIFFFLWNLMEPKERKKNVIEKRGYSLDSAHAKKLGFLLSLGMGHWAHAHVQWCNLI